MYSTDRPKDAPVAGEFIRNLQRPTLLALVANKIHCILAFTKTDVIIGITTEVSIQRLLSIISFGGKVANKYWVYLRKMMRTRQILGRLLCRTQLYCRFYRSQRLGALCSERLSITHQIRALFDGHYVSAILNPAGPLLVATSFS